LGLGHILNEGVISVTLLLPNYTVRLKEWWFSKEKGELFMPATWEMGGEQAKPRCPLFSKCLLINQLNMFVGGSHVLDIVPFYLYPRYFMARITFQSLSE
jgi:hypothetical protein